MNTKRIIVLGFALVAASAAALLARGLMGGGTPKVEAKIAPPPIAMSEVLVATSNIQPGLTLKPEMVKWQSWPASAVDASFITHAAAPNLEDAINGTVVRVPLFAGQPITNTAIVHGDASGFMAATLGDGMRAISITISADSSAGGFILPNDRVDVIVTRRSDSNNPRGSAKTILTNLRVLAVDQTYRQDKDTRTVVGKTATVEVTPEQAESISAAATTGQLSLALRPLSDANAGAVDDAARKHRSASVDGPVSVIRYGMAGPGGRQENAQ
jgi:pilus assembly protein CpaB